jgi:hypothetical protein
MHISNVTEFYLEWEMFMTKVVSKIKTYFMFSNFMFSNFIEIVSKIKTYFMFSNFMFSNFMFKNFIRKSCRLWDNVEEYVRVGKATGNMAHAHYMLDT